MCAFQHMYNIRRESIYENWGKREMHEEDCRIREWSARFLSYRGIHIYLHIARSGATVVPRSRVQAREALPRFLPQRAASVLRIVGSSPERAWHLRSAFASVAKSTRAGGVKWPSITVVHANGSQSLRPDQSAIGVSRRIEKNTRDDAQNKLSLILS